LDGRLHAGLLHPDVPLDRLRDRVGDRVDAFAVVDRDPRAADPFELVDDLVDGDAGPQAEGGEAGDSLREGGGIPAAAADLGEDFEEALLVLVDRHIQRAVPGEDLLGPARDHVGPGPRPQGRGFRRDLDSHLRRLAGFRDADVQDLVLAGAVAVDRDPLAVEVVREFLALHDALVPNQAELRFATAGRVRDHRERARGGDGGDVRVAKPQPLFLMAAALPRGIDAALPRELRALIISRLLDKLHDL